jgi:polyphosphate kinase 2 (PPK2 family)
MATGNQRPVVKMERKAYEKELHKLQIELSRLQDWAKETGERIIILFEGRDAAGKGGTIKAITERVSPRVFRVVARRCGLRNTRPIAGWRAGDRWRPAL